MVKYAFRHQNTKEMINLVFGTDRFLNFVWLCNFKLTVQH